VKYIAVPLGSDGSGSSENPAPSNGEGDASNEQPGPATEGWNRCRYHDASRVGSCVLGVYDTGTLK
jgi:hypothetical protein